MAAGRMMRIVAALAASAAAATLAAPGASAVSGDARGGSGDILIGPTNLSTSNGIGACSGLSAADRPCLYLSTAIPGATLASPCAGTVTRFRLNGVPSANTYRPRVVTQNGDGSVVGTASGTPVTIPVDGINSYELNMPIAAGQYFAIDFQDSTAAALRWNFVGPGVSSGYFYSFPEDGTPESPTGVEQSYYLFNASVRCGTDPGGGPGPDPDPGTKQKKCKKKKKKGTKKTAAAAKKKKKGCKKRKRKKK